MHWVALVILVVLVLVYVLIGGAVFMELEKDNETNMTEDTHVAFKSFIGNNTCVAPEDLAQFAQAVIDAYKAGIFTSQKKQNDSNWDYDSAVFFAVSVITSIGYGHLSPSTSGGQTFFIFYAIIGIPLCATMLIGLGERLSRPYKSLERTRDFTRYHKAEKLVRMIVFTLICFVIFSIIPAVIIMRFEEWNFVESWYFTIVTLTTVGFGDKVPGLQSSPKDKSIYRIATEIWIFCGLAWLSMVFHMAVHYVRLVTNKIDAATNVESNLRIDIKSTQVQRPTEHDPLLHGKCYL